MSDNNEIRSLSRQEFHSFIYKGYASYYRFRIEKIQV
jgi:hypothetical protein